MNWKAGLYTASSLARLEKLRLLWTLDTLLWTGRWTCLTQHRTHCVGRSHAIAPSHAMVVTQFESSHSFDMQRFREDLVRALVTKDHCWNWSKWGPASHDWRQYSSRTKNDLRLQTFFCVFFLGSLASKEKEKIRNLVRFLCYPCVCPPLVNLFFRGGRGIDMDLMSIDRFDVWICYTSKGPFLWNWHKFRYRSQRNRNLWRFIANSFIKTYRVQYVDLEWNYYLICARITKFGKHQGVEVHCVIILEKF